MELAVAKIELRVLFNVGGIQARMHYFRGSLVYAVCSLALAVAYGYFSGKTPEAAFSALWICIVLAVLEISLSFDNAVANAQILQTMSELWQRRFLTWGMLLAVLGMRFVFPISIVALAGKLNPLKAFNLALHEPAKYVAILSGAHTAIMGYGGAFLMLVGLKFFFDEEKDTHWLAFLERPLQTFAGFEAFEIVGTLLGLIGVSALLPLHEAHVFLISGAYGIATFFAVDWIGEALQVPPGVTVSVQRAGLATFIYLEILDASFSFDGVIGAFAVSTNLVIITLGLGIGAMFVRSMTIALVRSGALTELRYLEHGAFWAILALACIMFASAKFDIPDTVTGLIGAVFIGASYIASIQHNKRANPYL